MKRSLLSLTLASALAAAGASGVLAQSISDVEEARASERSGRWLTDREVDALNSYGGNDNVYRARGYIDRADDTVYVGPTARRYAGPWINRYLD